MDALRDQARGLPWLDDLARRDAMGCAVFDALPCHGGRAPNAGIRNRR